MHWFAIFFVAACILPLVYSKPVRKDWATLSRFEKDEFISGCNILKQSGEYDALVRIHLIASETPTPDNDEEPDVDVRNGESLGPSFLPWHRHFAHLFELAMRRALEDPDWALPYWNFIRDAELSDPASNPMWSASELGGTGRPLDDVVVDGPFANWPIRYSLRQPGDDRPEEYLERSLGRVSGSPAQIGDLENAYNQTSYDCEPYSFQSECGFRSWIQGSWSVRGAQDLYQAMHSQAHGYVGGSMLSATAPNDPVFWLMISFVDGVWYEWQEVQRERRPGSTFVNDYQPAGEVYPQGHNLDDMMVSLQATPRMVLDLEELDYTYDGSIPSASISLNDGNSSMALLASAVVGAASGVIALAFIIMAVKSSLKHRREGAFEDCSDGDDLSYDVQSSVFGQSDGISYPSQTGIDGSVSIASV